MDILTLVSDMAAKLFWPALLVICLIIIVIGGVWVIRFIRRKPSVELCRHCHGTGECHKVGDPINNHSCDYCRKKTGDEFARVAIVPCGYCGGTGMAKEEDKTVEEKRAGKWPNRIWLGAVLLLAILIFLTVFMAFHDMAH